MVVKIALPCSSFRTSPRSRCPYCFSCGSINAALSRAAPALLLLLQLLLGGRASRIGLMAIHREADKELYDKLTEKY